MRKSLSSLEEVSTLLQAATLDGKGAAAVNYLRLFALIALGWMWVRIARASLTEGDRATTERNLAFANFFAAHMLPQTRALEFAIAAGPDPVMDLDADLF